MTSEVLGLFLPLLVFPLWGMARSRSGAWGDTALLRLGLVALLICGEAAVVLSQDLFLWTTAHAESARASLANGNRYVSADVSPAGFTLGRDINGDGRSDMPQEWEVLQPEAVGLAWKKAAFFVGAPAMLCAIVSVVRRGGRIEGKASAATSHRAMAGGLAGKAESSRDAAREIGLR